MPEIKFCGMTRPEDVAVALELGVDYVGVILAASPRQVSPARARDVLAPTHGQTGTRRVGVFGASAAEEIAAVARELDLDVVQLHAVSSLLDIDAVRGGFGGAIWGVARIGAAGLLDWHRALFTRADGVVLDTQSARGLGGTGEVFDWSAVASALSSAREAARLILAGGLHAGNVREAIETLGPDVVDVSSGIERAPGIKDAERMRAFRDAAVAAARR